MDREVATITQAVYTAADRVILKSEGIQLWLCSLVQRHQNTLVVG